MERLLRQQLVAEVREFLFDLVNLVEVDVDAGSVADDREPSVLPLVETPDRGSVWRPFR